MAKRTAPKLKMPTMYDVARLAGVSQPTVSRVLNQNDTHVQISDDTRQRVLAAVETLGYRPNVLARSLRTQRTNMIAIMIADISNPFYHTITRTIQDIATQHNYDVIISNTDHIAAYEHRFCETLMRRPVDGVVLVPYHLTNNDLDHLLQRTGAALAVLGRHIDHPYIDVVSADDESATYHAVRWLIHTKGHQRIGFIGAPPHFSVSERRQRGYERALREAGITPCAEWVGVGDFTHESGQAVMRALLALPERPTAVFACNDIMAIGALNTAFDMGYDVPKDVAIVGFDNVPAAMLVRPTLTTVAQYPVEIGQCLAEALFARMAHHADDTHVPKGRRFSVPCQLIERRST